MSNGGITIKRIEQERRAFVRTGLACGIASLPWMATAALAQRSDGGSPRRIGLVIGNGDYPQAALRFAESDARLIGRSLRQLHFSVTEHFHLHRQAFHRVLDQFMAQLRNEPPGTTAWVFYAGHGIQIEGLNYLIPVDRSLRSMDDVRDYGIPVARLVRQMGEANASGVNVVVLDACRNNPFSRSRSPSRGGLAAQESPRGVLVAYATDPDKPALDGGGRNGQNSVYSEALAEQLPTPGVPIEGMFKRVRQIVAHATQGRQTPWEHSSLQGEFVLAPR